MQYNIDGRMYKAIVSLYSGTQCCMKLRNDLFTDWFNVQLGVKQGDNLSPTLFSLYINELVKEINNLNIDVNVGNRAVSMLLYADDMVLISNIEENLQIMLDTMYDWCSKWRLSVNRTKSQIIHFRRSKQKVTNFVFKYGGQNLEIVKEYKYLGVIFDEHLKFTQCSKTLAESGGRALGAVRSKFKQYKDIGYKTFTTMYNAGVTPITHYNASVWRFDSKNKNAELVQNKAIRYVLGVHNSTPIPALVGEMGWLPSKYSKYICMLQLWNHLVVMSNDRLTKHVFNIDYNQTENHNNWCCEIREILSSIGEQELYDRREVCNIEICKEKMFECAQTEWKLNVQAKPKLRTYMLNINMS